MTLEPIAFIHNEITEGGDENWGSVISQIEMLPEYAAGLRGLDQFSHAVIIFHMHQANFNAEADLLRRPRGREDLPELGIFAQRAKHRPNPIGITACEIITVKDGTLTVRGLDAINGTPVLDIKPYVPAFDARDAVRIPAWMEEIMQGYF